MGIINVTIDTRGATGGPRIPKGQPGAGRFTDAQTAFNQRNRDLADEIQANVVLEIQKRRDPRRRSASTNRLVRVTAARGNQNVVLGKSIAVGMTDFLDRSEAKYWRTFEEGSAVTFRSGGFIGTPLFLKGKYTFPSAHGAKPGLRTGEEESSKKPQMYVQHEIAPRSAYAEASRDVGGQAAGVFRQYLDAISGLPLVNI